MIVEWAVRRIRNSIAVGRNMDEVMLLVYQDLIKETNMQLFEDRPTDPKQVAEAFERRAVFWENLSTHFPNNLNKNGFRLLLRKSAPQLYKILIKNGFKDIPQEEDPEYVPTAERRHKGRKNGRKTVSPSGGEIQKEDGGSGS